jgi:hypothetical protein
MKTDYKVSKRLDEILEIKREIAKEVEHLPTREALQEILRKASKTCESYPFLKEGSPRRKDG